MVLSAAKRGFILGYTAEVMAFPLLLNRRRLMCPMMLISTNNVGFNNKISFTMIEEKDHGETGQKFGVLEWS